MGFLSIVAYILMAIGGLASIVGTVWFLIVAFRESLLWGIGCLLCGPVALFFLIKFWQDSWKPWVLQLLGSGVAVLGFVILGATAPSTTAAFDDFATEPYGEEYSEEGYSEETYAEEDYSDAYGDATADDADGVDADGRPVAPSADAPADLDDGPGLEANLPESPIGTSGRSNQQSSAPPPTRVSGTTSRRSDDGSIDIDFAEEYIGQRLKLTKNNGKVVYCRLVDVTDEALIIQQPLGGGHVKFTIVKTSIASLAKDDR